MSYEPKPGSGTLFKNKSRQNDKAPDYKGYFLTPTGEVQGISAWIKDTQNGKMLSLSSDEREGKYWAEKLGKPMVEFEAERSSSRPQRRDDGGRRELEREEGARDRFARGGNDRRQQTFIDDDDDDSEIQF